MQPAGILVCTAENIAADQEGDDWAIMHAWGQVGDALNATIQLAFPVPRNQRDGFCGYVDRANRMRAKLR